MNVERVTSVSLALDGAYFRQAASLAEIAKLADAEFAKWQSVIQDTNSRIDEIIDRNPEMDDEAHDLCVVLDRDWQSFNGATGKLIQCAAAVYVLCGACLKARINIRAESVLERKKFAEFDKLSLVGKWLFYPKLAAVGNFDPSSEPIQSIQVLAKRRNTLVHFKSRKENTRHPYDMPTLVEGLGLRANACNESLRSVRSAVRKLAEMEGENPPPWLDEEWFLAFSVEW